MLQAYIQMATLYYVDIPSCATRLHSTEPSTDLRPAPKVLTSLPQPDKSPPLGLPSTPTQATSPTKSSFNNFQQILLSSTLQIPGNAVSAPRDSKGTLRLLSTRDPLSIPITTVNFKRFVSKTGPVFWLQDRFEEVLMWRKGWKYTSVWVAAYAFICYFPRMILLLPNVIILGVLLATHPSIRHKHLIPSSDTKATTVPPPPPAQSSEGSVDWLANVQAIQNLMGAVSDVHDFVLPMVPHLNYSSPYTPIILSITAITFMLLLPLVNLLPLRATFFILGLVPFSLTHPFTRYSLSPALLQLVLPRLKLIRAGLTRLVDNDRLEDKHWRSELREVELWENERWLLPTSGDESLQLGSCWSKVNLKPGERRAWTRGRDGWSGVADDGSGDVSNLTFSLSPGWLFVETEEWRPDLEGTWIVSVGTDDNGWVYTNDTWTDPHPAPLEEWKASNGVTRRRRWIRRIYYDPATAL